MQHLKNNKGYNYQKKDIKYRKINSLFAIFATNNKLL